MKTFASLLLACVPAMTLAACAAHDDGGDDLGTSDLDAVQGGLTLEDEAPAFGDPAAFEDAAVEAERAFDDPMATTADVAALDGARDGAAYRALVLWGQLPPDRAVDTATTWSGTISLNRGAIVVRRTIGFEDRTDAVLPRTDRKVVAFDSVTKPAADGLALLLLDPTPASADPLILTYTAETGETHQVRVAELLRQRTVLVTDDLGNQMVAVAMPRVPGGCEHGFMRGRWRPIVDGRGSFHGRITDEEMEPIGHLRGHYGQRSTGETVIFGKFIALDGAFRGILAGHYGRGGFGGVWRTRQGDVGGFQGEYTVADPSDPTRNVGLFVGRWAERGCNIAVGTAEGPR